MTTAPRVARPRLTELGDQVRRVLPRPPAEVVDAGGGTGQLSVPLAADGWTVTVVDPSAAMLATCLERAADLGPEVGARLRAIQGDADQVTDLLGAESADAALCHGVLEVVADPAAVVAALARVLRPGGVLSLIAVNRARLATRAARRGDYTEALRLLDDPVVQGGRSRQLGQGSRAWTAQELRPWLLAAGLEVAGEYGLRAFADAPPDADADQLEARHELERRAADREPYRSLAEFLHLVARRP
jgi:S-adenosylmethionine-dependent methyltransferase